jgi:choline dehydrogenase-like flavoprotein
VLLLEEGGYYRTEDFKSDPRVMLPRLYRNAGTTMILGNSPVIFSEGRCVGGSTVINAGICYRTPDKVLKRWGWEHGLTDMTSAGMNPYFEQVERALNVSLVPPEIFGKDTLKLKEGAERLGYKTTPIYRNIRACQGTNLCIWGCPTGAKQSTLVTYVPEALKYGARLIANCRVDRILAKDGKATGVAGVFLDLETGKTPYKIEVKADLVFACGGAIQTPILLQRSGLAKKNPLVGKNLFIHPNAKAIGIFDEEIKGWQGSIQGYQVDHFADEGFTFFTTFLPPGVMAFSLPYFGNESYELMKHYNYMTSWGVLVEDTHAGRVRLGPFNQPIISYQFDALDEERMLHGLALLAEIFFAAGARAVHLPVRGLELIERPDQIAQLFEKSIKISDVQLFTVHAMGTCRMGRDPNKSVVNEHQEFHTLRNLFVADASVFPTPIRVNPMITIMALATRCAEYVANQRAHYIE